MRNVNGATGIRVRRSFAIIISLNVIVAAIAIAYFLPAYALPTATTEWFTLLLFFVVGVYSIYMFSRTCAERGLAAETIFWFFSYWFFFIVPLTQYMVLDVDYAPLDGPRFVYLLVVLIWLLAFQLSAKYLPKWAYFGERRPAVDRQSEILWSRLITISLVLSIWVVWYASTYGFFILFLRLPNSSFIQGPLPLYLLSNLFARPAVIVALLLGLAKLRSIERRRLKDWMAISLLALLALITNLPTSMARFYVFAVAVAMLLSLAPHFAKRSVAAYLFLLVSIVGSSVLHLARGFRSTYDIGSRFTLEYLHEGHFPSFSNLAHAISYVSKEGITWGQQIVGALLFWVPRSIWPDKPIGTAEFLVHNYLEWSWGLTSSNISMPAIAEFFIDFHLFGVVAGAVFFAVISVNVDRMHERAARQPGRVTPLILSGFIIGLWLFVNRGDFQSAFAYTAGISSAVVVVSMLSTKASHRI